MRHTSRHKLGIGLTFALAATALGGTSVLAAQDTHRSTTATGAQSVLPPDPWQSAWTQPNREYESIVRSPETGFNVRIPTADSPLEAALE